MPAQPSFFVVIFATSVAPSLDRTDSHTIGVAWTELSGLLSVLLKSVVTALSARPRLLEQLTRGLDKIYRLHKWLGIAGMLFGVAHWLTATGDGHRPPSGAEDAATAAVQPTADGASSATPVFLQSNRA